MIHGVARKLAHLAEYAILGALWFRGVTRSAWPDPGRRLARAGRQRRLRDGGRDPPVVRAEPHGQPGDVLIDSLGALAGVVPARLGLWGAAETITGACCGPPRSAGPWCWRSDVAAGASGGVLWVTVPLAAAARLICGGRPLAEERDPRLEAIGAERPGPARRRACRGPASVRRGPARAPARPTRPGAQCTTSPITTTTGGGRSRAAASAAIPIEPSDDRLLGSVVPQRMSATGVSAGRPRVEQRAGDAPAGCDRP